MTAHDRSKIIEIIFKIHAIQDELHDHGDMSEYVVEDATKTLQDYKDIRASFQEKLDNYEMVERVIELIQLSRFDDVKKVEKYIHELWEK